MMPWPRLYLVILTSKLSLFKSQTEVPRQEKARRNIQLVKNGEVLITNLPQLGADKIHGDIIIHLSKF